MKVWRRIVSNSSAEVTAGSSPLHNANNKKNKLSRMEIPGTISKITQSVGSKAQNRTNVKLNPRNIDIAATEAALIPDKSFMFGLIT